MVFVLAKTEAFWYSVNIAQISTISTSRQQYTRYSQLSGIARYNGHADNTDSC